jgi:RNA polymerase sigma-70 factor (ECF subfamily)
VNRPGGPERQEGVARESADAPSDRELLVAVAGGDTEALRALYERHAPWLLLRLARRCGDRGIVEDAVQDTFVAIWRKPESFGGTGEVAAWIWGIGIRRLIDRLRRVRPSPVLLAPRVCDDEPSAEEQVLLGVEYGDLAGALHRLSPELRSAVQATVLDGLTTREAARLLGIPAGTVKTRVMRAKAQLREELA